MDVVANRESTSLSHQRLKTVLTEWEQDKHQKCYDYLYICARKLGQKINAIWISPQENALVIVERKFGRELLAATSFDIEFLYAPQDRQVNLNIKNQWNSLRGKYAAIIHYQDYISRWSSLEMLANNLSFLRVTKNHLAKLKKSSPCDTCIPITLYKTRQFFCSNTDQTHTLTLFRGNHVVKLSDVNKTQVLITLKAMTHWLASQVNQQGKANYKYWPSRGDYASSNNAIRQWMATVCLNRVAKAFKSQALQDIASKNLDYNLRTTFKSEEDFGYIWMNGSAKLGSASLAALAILESTDRKKYLTQERALTQLLTQLSHNDGSFDTFYIPRERKDNQNFYSGEALLFLASRYAISRNPSELKRFMAGFNHYRSWHLKNRNPAFVPWHTQAYYLVWEVTRDESLKSFIFEMNDWLLSMQQWDSAEFPDMQGRFYDPSRPYYGPPHASSTGVYLEGLIDAFSLAKTCGEDQRAEQYRIAIVRGIRSIIQLQYKDEIDCYYVKNTAKVLGGVRTTVYDNTIRIDNVQHALMAFLKIASRFSESDYANAETIVNPPYDNQAGRQYFRKLSYRIPFDGIKKEVKENESLWLENTSRQDNISVQKETNTIFLRSAKKPYPKGYSSNDIHLSQETKNAEKFPLLMTMLYNFARSINGTLARATIVRLQANGKVYPHIDEGEYYKYRDRYHIVVHSPEGSEMVSGGEKQVWREGEFWWFDNKAVHEAYNSSSESRIHIIFDIQSEQDRKRCLTDILKQKLLFYKPDKDESVRQNRKVIAQAESVKFDSSGIAQNIQKKYSSINFEGYQSRPLYIESFNDVYILGNKFTLVNDQFRVYEETLPTYYHIPEYDWLDRKPFIRHELYSNDIIHIDEPCVLISNANWKNYWHWHIQCLLSVSLVKKAGLWGKVKFLCPPLNAWRESSLRALGVDPKMLIKVRTNLLKVKSLIRPSTLDKTQQYQVSPFTKAVFDDIRAGVICEKASKVKRKLYVSRTDATARKMLNEKTLMLQLEKQGYEIVVPGDLSYEAQIKLFAEASVIVGAHGAGLTNIGFCNKGTQIVELFSSDFFYHEKTAYMSQASIFGLDYTCHVFDSGGECAGNTLEWLVDVNKVVSFLKAI